MHELVELLQQAFQEWLDDKGATLGAALAYYTLFSMAPVVLLFIGLAGLLLGQEDAQGRVVEMFRGLLGQEGGDAMQQIVNNASHEKTSSIWAAIFGGLMMLFGASMVFVELQSSLNIVWGVLSKPESGVGGFIRTRVFSFGLFLSALFVLFVVLTLASYIVAAGAWLSAALPAGEVVGHALNFGLSLLILSGLSATIFKVVPDVKIAWCDVWLGAFIAALLLAVGKFLVQVQFLTLHHDSPFGAAGSVVVLVVWSITRHKFSFSGRRLRRFTQAVLVRMAHPHESHNPGRLGKLLCGPDWLGVCVRCCGVGEETHQWLVGLPALAVVAQMEFRCWVDSCLSEGLCALVCLTSAST